MPTFRLNEAVKRNTDRFPEDFRFQLTREEFARLISQSAISNAEAVDAEPHAPNSSQTAMSSHTGRGGRRKLPWAFTEHGALMAATVLNSPRAVEMSFFIVRAFVRMREELLTNAVVLKRLAHGARRRGDGVVRLRRTARDLVAGSRRSRPCRLPTEQIDKKLLQHDLVLRDVVEKLLPLLNAPPEPEPPKRRIGFNPNDA